MGTANELPKRPVEWVGGLVSLPTYVADGDDPFRPEALVWMIPGGALLGMETARPGELLPRAADTFRTALEKPLFGPVHIPARIRVAREDLAAALRAVVGPTIAIVCDATPELDQFIRTMRERMAGKDFGTPSYISDAKGASAVGAFFQATATLYRQAPWTVVPDDTKLLIATVPSLGVQDAAISIIGQSGKRFGVIIFRSLRDFQACLEGAEALVRGEEPEMPEHLGLNFDVASELRPELQREIEKHGWELASPLAAPWLVAVDKQLIARPPTAKELAVAETLSLALTTALVEKTALLSGWTAGGEFSRTFTVNTHGGLREVTLRTVV